MRKSADGRMELRFWGVRGTLPIPGARTLRYGGNTSCVSLEVPDSPLFIFDAGTGIKALGDDIMRNGGSSAGIILISHPHWDHINALPFFAPLYAAGHDYQILGPSQDTVGIRDVVERQMDKVHFPITSAELRACLSFRNLGEETFRCGAASVSTLLLSHAGRCLGYRVSAQGKTFCYVTDNELFPPGTAERDEGYLARLTSFVQDADILVTDTTYRDEVYESRRGRGHSRVREVVELAHEAGVKLLCLWHHDPDDTDHDIDTKLASARRRIAELASPLEGRAPAEGGRGRV